MSDTIPDGIALVKDADMMDDEKFALHMTHRHSESLGGLTELDPTMEPDLLGIYRTFHWWLHVWRVDLKHVHNEAA
jgi:hypothetical protein